MQSLLIFILIAYASMVTFLYVYQRKLIYQPSTDISEPVHYGLTDFTDVNVTAADDIRLQLWYRLPAKGFPTIIYYHGNASHLGNRAGIYSALAEKGFGVLALSYRGYGRSEGEPTEQGLYSDARATIKMLKAQGITLNRIILFGESLGTGIAIQMANEFKDIGAVVLQAPYTSVSTRAAEIYSFVPVRLLIKDHFDSLSKIPKVKAPLLIFHGELDNTIPVEHGRTLLAAATCPKEAFFLPNVSHNDFDSDLISAHVLDFAKKYNLIEQ